MSEQKPYTQKDAERAVDKMTKKIMNHGEQTGKPVSFEQAQKQAAADQRQIDKERK